MAGTSSTPLTSSRKMGKATREAFGQALATLGEQHNDIVVVDGDVHNSTRTDFFAKKFPERFFNVGIAESDMVGVVLPRRSVRWTLLSPTPIELQLIGAITR